MTESTDHPTSGLWQPTQLQAMCYGPSSVKKQLISHLPSDSSKAFIITGSSLATKTSLIGQVESLLGVKHHAGTFASIGQHAPITKLDEAVESVLKDSSVDTLISIGGEVQSIRPKSYLTAPTRNRADSSTTSPSQARSVRPSVLLWEAIPMRRAPK